MADAGEVIWMDGRPNKALNAVIASLGYLFFWGTELLLLYWLVQELLKKTSVGFVAAGAITVAWTVVAAFATVRLHALTRPSRVLYLSRDAIGVEGPGAAEFSFGEVEKVIVAPSDEGFEVQLTSRETQLRVPLRDRKGFLDACKQITVLEGKVASTGILE